MATKIQEQDLTAVAWAVFDRPAWEADRDWMIQMLGRGGKFGHIYKIPRNDNGDDSKNESLWYRTDQGVEIPQDWIDTADVYWGICPTDTKLGKKNRTNKEIVTALTALWGDFDVKDFGHDADKVAAHVDGLSARPTMEIDSGSGGDHAYWVLREPYRVTAENREEVEKTIDRWREYIGSDPRATGLARILRVPGTYNRKPDYPEPLPVTIRRCDRELLYTYEELVAMLPAPKKETPPPPPPPATTATNSAFAGAGSVSDEFLLEKMFSSPKNGAAIQSLWNGNDRGDHSGADQALCNHLVFWTDHDAARVDRLFRRSDLYREKKWNAVHRASDKATYGQMTIEKAIAGVNQGWPGPRVGKYDNMSFADTVDEDGVITPHPLGFLNKNPLDYRPEDGGILDVWRRAYGEKWRYVTGYEIWRKWAETHWELDQDRGIPAQIQDLTDALNRLARKESDRIDALNQGIRATNKANKTEAAEIFNAAKPYVAATKRSAARVRSVVYMAENKQATSAERWDQGNILNLKNGVLDLDTLKVREQTRDDLLTYVLPYEYNEAATAPKFEKFISEILVKTDEDGNFTGKKDKDGNPTAETDQELVNLFQELWGYTLTTDTSKHAMAWLSGEGSNGKSLALSILQALLGPLALTVNFAELGNPRSYVKSDIPGKRMILSTESERGATVAEGEIRQIASGDRQSTRPIYGSNFQFTPVCTIWWAMNDKPVIKDTSNAMWRRLKLIPFNQTFSETPKPGEMQRDTELQSKLMAELPGILNWAIVGLERLRKNGKFTRSAAMEKAIADYKNESNPVDQWRGERLGEETKNQTWIMQSVLYQDYTAWCYQNGRHALASANFSTELKRLGILNKRSNRGSLFKVQYPGPEQETTASNG